MSVAKDNKCSVGQDYVYGPYIVTFPAGVTSSHFNVLIIDDDEHEDNETFELTINSFFLPLNISTIHPDQVTVIIKNDDCKWYEKCKIDSQVNMKIPIFNAVKSFFSYIATS